MRQAYSSSCAVSKLGVMPPAEWMEMSKTSILESVDFGNMEFNLHIMGMATISKDFGYQPSQEWMDAHFCVVERLQYQRIGDLSRGLWALSNFTNKPPIQWVYASYACFGRQIRDIKPADMGNVCLYLARYLQVGSTCTRIFDRARREVGFYTGDELAAVAYLLAISNFQAPNERLLDDLVVGLQDTVATCTLTGCEMVYNALPVLGSGYNELSALQQRQAAKEAVPVEDAPVEEAGAEVMAQ
eukprot:gene22086-29150_t